MTIIRHYLKNGIRGFFRQKAVALINVLGLSTGIASFILILLFLQNELGYEKHIPESDDMYRLVEIQKPAGIDVQHVAITSGPWGPALVQELPEVIETLRLAPAYGGLLRVEGKTFRQKYGYFAESSVMRFFNIPLVAGNPDGLLDEPNTAVVSERVAEKLFGQSDVVGSSFHYGEQPYKITGVIKNHDRNSHLIFEMILSFPTFENAVPQLANWGSNYLSTYLLLKPGSSPEATEENILKLIDTRMNEMGYHDAPRQEMYLQPFTDIHLKSGNIKFSIYDTKGDIVLIYVFSLVAFLILFIACINYINLATARAAKRSMEVGMRKTLGAGPSSIFYQFMGESLITVVAALVISVGLVELFLPQFNAILNTTLKVDFVNNWIFNIGLLGLLAVVGLLAGAYPALFMSRFQPAMALKGQARANKSAGWGLRKVLVTLQFAISAMLVFATLVFFNQWVFMRNADIGIDYENVVNLSLSQDNTDAQILDQVKAQFLSYPGVEGVAMASGSNGVSGSQGPIRVADSLETELMVRYGYVDEDFFPVMGIDIIEGRNFSRSFGTDISEAVIINACAARTLGWENAVGKQFTDYHDTENRITVVGVIEDYNFYSLHGEIEPAIYRILPERNRSIVVRIDQNKQEQTLDQLKVAWGEFFKDIPFEPVFIKENIEMQYKAEGNTMNVITFFAVLCIIISSLGLYGLTAFMAEQKRKEIGIRKVLGESVISIVAGIQKIFLKLVVIALIISMPLVYLYMQRWLDNFAYRINMSWWYFVASAAIVLGVAFLTVLSHSLRAANANPVESIKYE